MEFNKSNFEAFRKDVEAALKEVSKKYEVEIKTGKIKYSEYDFTMEIKSVKINEDVNIQQEKFNQVCYLYNFTPDQYKVEFSSNGKVFQLVGFNTNKPKNCCSLYCVTDGKTYQCNDEMVRRALK